MTRLRDRPTVEIVILALAALVVVVTITTVVGIFITAWVRPDENLEPLLGRIGAIVNSLIGAVIGYVAGKASTNGKHTSE